MPSPYRRLIGARACRSLRLRTLRPNPVIELAVTPRGSAANAWPATLRRRLDGGSRRRDVRLIRKGRATMRGAARGAWPGRLSPPAPAPGSFSIRIAVALNSAVPDLGSVASIVRLLVVTSSWKWSVMNARPGRRPSSTRTGASTWPRRETTRTRSPAASPKPRDVLGRQVERLAAPPRVLVATRLDAGVVRVQVAAGRQADREVVVEAVDRRVVLDRHERRPVARDRVLPQP